MLEYNLIKLFLKKEIYDSYYQYVTGIQNREVQKLFYSLRELHASGKDEYTLDELEINFAAQYPTQKQAEKDLYSLMFKRIREADVDETLVEKYLIAHKESQAAHRIVAEAIEVAEGRKPFSTLIDLISKVEVDQPITEEIELVTMSLKELMEEEKQIPGFKWRLNCLNKALGQLRKGALGHIFARVETGKSAMWISELTYMVQQMQEEQVALVFFNEEGGRDIVYRLYSAMLNRPYKDVIANQELAEEEFRAKGGHRIKFVDRPTLHKKEMERIIKHFNPALIIIDNLDKVKGFDADRKDLILAEIYKWAREIAKEFAPVLSVGQADATAHNRKWLDEAQMADSKTGKPSELDFIIGIGRTDDEGMKYVRHLSIPKNKLRGDEGTLEEHRHGKFDVILHPDVSIYEDIDHV